MIRNDTPHTWKLKLWKDEKELHGAWYCDAPLEERYQVYEREHWMQSEYWGGFTRHNVIARKVLGPDGELLADEYVTENHVIMMYSPMLSESGEPGKGG
jgi:vancomycin resistance protein VanW